jgi:hypothetical protein
MSESHVDDRPDPHARNFAHVPYIYTSILVQGFPNRKGYLKREEHFIA